MNGDEWVTLIGFTVAMIILSFISREAALWTTLAVGGVIVLRHNIVPISNATGGNRL